MNTIPAPTFDYGSRGRVGLLLPSVNRIAEPQLRTLLQPGIGLATTRLKLTGTSDEALMGMTRDIEPAADLLKDAGVDLIVFHCTAVSTYSQELESSILQRIATATGTPVTATSRALVESLHALGAHQLVLISPYSDRVNVRESAFFQAQGFEVLTTGGRACDTAEGIMAIAPEEWMEIAMLQADTRADAYVLSCTAARTAEVVEQLEETLGRPVVTSNTAVAWACMRALDSSRRVEGFGQLLLGLWRPKPRSPIGHDKTVTPK